MNLVRDYIMKTLLTLSLILWSYTISQEATLTPTKINEPADFRISLKYLLSHEGYYSYHKDDKGGETYCGITRRFQPNWIGWNILDQYKTEHEIKWNGRIEELDHWVLDFYLDLWVKERFYLLKDQHTADYVFDFRINSTVGALIVRRALNDVGTYIPIVNTMDSSTIASINKVNKSLFLSKLRRRRISFYNAIVARDASQAKFLNHWMQRSNN